MNGRSSKARGETTAGADVRSAYEAWRTGVDRELADAGRRFDELLRHTLAGEQLEPLYAALHAPAPGVEGSPGAAPFTRGNRCTPAAAGLPWVAVHRTERRDPAAANAELLDDLEGGLSGLWLQAARGVRRGDGAADGHHGVALASAGDLERLLGGVLLEGVDVFLDLGAATPAACTALERMVRDRGHEPATLRIHAGFDPLGDLLDTGRTTLLSTNGPGLAAELVEPWLERFGGRALAVSSLALHNSGADAALELGYLLASGVATLQALVEAGVEPARAARSLSFRVGLDRELFGEVAKLRALRNLWCRALLACGIDDPPAPHVQAVSGRRTLCRRDTWVNLLRVAGHAFAGIIGGAESLWLARFDTPRGAPSSLGRRMARNLHTILFEESHLGDIADPVGGSYYLEARTEGLARLGWDRFCELEDLGGARAAIVSGALSERVQASAERRARAIATRRMPLLGTSEFPPRSETAPEPGVPDDRGDAIPLASGWVPDGGPATDRAPLPERRDGAPFEALLEHAQRLTEPPRVFLANLGRLRDHNARARFASDLFSCAALRVVHGKGFVASGEGPARAGGADAARDERQSVLEQWRAEGSPDVVCVCGTDEAYSAQAALLGTALREAGARHVYLAGAPGELRADLEAAGYTGFLHRGCDVLALLGELVGAERPQPEGAPTR